MASSIYGMLALLSIAAVFAWRIFAAGKTSQKAKELESDLQAAEDRLEMDREATEAEKQATALSDEEARKEAERWARQQ